MPDHRKLLTPTAQSFSIFSVFSQRMTKSDARIANYTAEHFHEVMSMTISDLAKGIGVSEITVSRFCRKLGLPGLQALKISLAGTSPNFDFVSDISEHDSNEQITSKIFKSIEEGLDKTLKLINFRAIDQAVDIMSSRPRLLLFGYGNSATVALDLATRLVRLGFSTEMSSDPHQQVTLAEICDPDRTAVLAISHTGSSNNLVESLSIARSRGCKVILLTSHERSPAANEADVVLLGVGPEVTNNSEATVSRLVQMAVGDALYTKLSLMNPKLYSASINRMRDGIARLKS
ncbi:MAG: MurR/RpiR family transcriptional regulator [Succinivibrionaceae bacterium]|nr:MurR/RpiR family transcriptional regulator [Succinivibrionaceae bacterium]